MERADGRIKNPWSAEEDVFIKNNYVKMTRKELAIELKRSLHSINKRVDRKLKLNKDAYIRSAMIGKKFGLLTAVKFVGRKDNKTLYECICECGSKKIMNYTTLEYGKAKSCGCLRFQNLEKSQHNSMFSMYKYSAKRRNIKFKLTFKQFKILISGNCYYCDTRPYHKPINRIVKEGKLSKIRGIFANGIDRKDNSVGYIIKNCVSCCSDCNYMKQDLSIDKFLNKIENIYNKMNLTLIKESDTVYL